MIFNFTAHEVHERAKSYDITPSECACIWELLDRQKFGYIIDDLLINPMCDPTILKMAFSAVKYAARALQNPSLDLYIYRNNELIDEDCTYFLDAIFENLQNDDHKDAKRFIKIAITVFEPIKICNHALYGFIDEATRKQLALAYFSNIKNDMHSPLSTSKMCDFGIKTLRRTKDLDILQAVYDAYPRFNIDIIKLFANNESTPGIIIGTLITQLTDYLTKDKGNLYYERVLNELKDHPNQLTSKVVKKIEESIQTNVSTNLSTKSSVVVIKDDLVCDFFRSAKDLIEKNKQMASARKLKQLGDDLLRDDIFS
jgi:hypothetical protein